MKKSIRIQLVILLAGVLLAGCGTDILDHVQRNGEKVPFLNESPAWADSLLRTMTLEEKAGQLLVIRADAPGVPVASDSSMIADLQPGGIIFFDGYSAKLEEITSIQQFVRLPLLAGLSEAAGTGLFDEPSPATLGAIDNPELIYEYGRLSGIRYKEKGINFKLGPNCNLSDSLTLSRAPSRPACSSDPRITAARASAYMSGLQEAGVLAIATTFPGLGSLISDTLYDFPLLPGALHEISDRQFYPFRRLIEAGVSGICAGNVIIRDVDSTGIPVTLSPGGLRTPLRFNMQYSGLIFTEDLNDQAIEKMYPEGQAAVQALLSGADVLVNPADPVAARNAIVAAVKNQQLSMDLIDDKVFRILLAKYWLEKQSKADSLFATADSLPVFPQEKQFSLLARSLAGQSIILAGDSLNFPIRHVHEKKFASVSIGTVTFPPFQKRLDDFYDVKPWVFSRHATYANFAPVLAVADQYDQIIVSLHGATADTMPGNILRPEIKKFLNELKQKTKVGIVVFGDPYALVHLKEFGSVMVAFNEDDLTQDLAAQAVWGAVETPGMIPVEMGGFSLGSRKSIEQPLRLQFAEPEDAGIASEDLMAIDSIARNAIYQGVMPGCQILVAKNSKLIYHKAFGYHTYEKDEKVRLNDLYDIASITKIAATTLEAMRCYDEKLFDLDTTLNTYIEELDTTRLKKIIIRDLFTHQAGLPPGLPIYSYMTVQDSVDSLRALYYHAKKDTEYCVQVCKDLWMRQDHLDSLWEKVKQTKVWGRGKYEYSDLGMYLVMRMIEELKDTTLSVLVEDEFYRHLGLKYMTYLPLKKFEKDQIIPTEKDKFYRKQLVHGFVHDPAAAMLGGVNGSAGLFSNAFDLAVIGQLLLNKGRYGGIRYISEKTVNLFTSTQPGSHRGLGFDKPPGICSAMASPNTFGHTGFTGTCIWIDPDEELIYIFLSNRVYPDAKNQKINIFKTRQTIHDIIYDAIYRYKAQPEIQADSLSIDSMPPA